MDQENIPQTALDQMVNNDTTQMIKAAIPYLPAQSRRFLSIYAKLTELVNTLSLFTPDTQAMSICETPPPPLEILRDLRQHCCGPAGKRLDDMVNLFAMAEMAKIMNDQKAEEGEEA